MPRPVAHRRVLCARPRTRSLPSSAPRPPARCPSSQAPSKIARCEQASPSARRRRRRRCDGRSRGMSSSRAQARGRGRAAIPTGRSRRWWPRRRPLTRRPAPPARLRRAPTTNPCRCGRGRALRASSIATSSSRISASGRVSRRRCGRGRCELPAKTAIRRCRSRCAAAPTSGCGEARHAQAQRAICGPSVAAPLRYVWPTLVAMCSASFFGVGTVSLCALVRARATYTTLRRCLTRRGMHTHCAHMHAHVRVHVPRTTHRRSYNHTAEYTAGSRRAHVRLRPRAHTHRRAPALEHEVARNAYAYA